MALAAVVPVEPIAPSENLWSHGRTPTPACVLPTGMPGQLHELGEFIVGVGVEDAAAGDDQRTLRGTDGLGGAGDVLVVGVGAADPPFTLGEELLGHVEGLGLDILRQRDGHGAGLGRIRQDPQAVVERREQLLRAGRPGRRTWTAAGTRR